jgi:hypothetical protein
MRIKRRWIIRLAAGLVGGIVIFLILIGGSDLFGTAGDAGFTPMMLTPDKQIATSIIQTNTAVAQAFRASQTAVQLAFSASQTAVSNTGSNATLTWEALRTRAAATGASIANLTDTPTATTTATPTPSPSPGEPASASDQDAAQILEVSLLSPGGRALGTGEVRIYAPETMKVSEKSRIRVEIELAITDTEAAAALAAPPTIVIQTPVGTLRATEARIDQVGGSRIDLHQIMAARLDGLDIENFIISPAHISEAQPIDIDDVNWWEWDIRPAGPEAIGENSLRISIYLPTTLEENAGIADLLETYPIYIMVEPDDEPETGKAIAGLTPTQREALSQTAQVSPSQPDKSSDGGETNYALYMIAALVLSIIGLGSYHILRHGSKTTQPPGPLQQAQESAGTKLNLFISYSRKDTGFVDRLLADLSKHKLEAWRDTSDITAGLAWDREIQNALNTCTHVLFVASENSVKSENVANEITFARDKDKPVIPLVLDNCEMPITVYRAQRVDFRGDYQPAFAKLMRHLGIETEDANT